MTGNRDRDDDAELIERLRALSRELVWPATPDLTGRATVALETGVRPRGTATRTGSPAGRRSPLPGTCCCGRPAT